MDLRITAWACVMFMALEMDRTNLSQANSDNFLEDLNLTTNGKDCGSLQQAHVLIAITHYKHK
jgi:hypothetical protein